MTTVRDVDKGYAKALKNLFGEKPKLKVGVFGEKAAASHPGPSATVGEIAAFHEFGTDKIPERSFIRGWADEHEGEAAAHLRDLCEKADAGKIDWAVVLDRFGLWCVAGIQSRISDNIPPPLADATIARKGSSVALIDTGTLRSSIAHEVTAHGEP